MSRKDSSHHTGCTAGSGLTTNEPKLNLGTAEDCKGPSSPTSVTSSSDKCMFDSRFSDSGVWSGSNIHSEEISTPDSPVSKSSEFTYSSDMKVQNDNKSIMRLDSGIDVSVSQQFSELSLKEDNFEGLNDLSSQAKPRETSTNINQQISSNQKTSPQPLTLLQKCFQPNEDGDTELHLAIIHKFVESVFALVRMVPHPDYLNIRNDDRQTPLHLAVLTRQPRLVRHLTCAGAALDIVDRCGNTALHLAVQADDLTCVRAITDPVTIPEATKVQLQYSPHPFHGLKDITDIHNYEGLTCVHLAALNGNIDILRYLLWYGADVNAKEWKGGETCLHMAVARKDIHMCRFLLDQPNLDVDEMNYAGVTAYQAAAAGGWDETVAEVLHMHGADTYLPTDSEEEDSDEEMLDISENEFSKGLKMNGGGLVNVGA